MENTFILGDALTSIKKIPSNTFDLILTDPPYDISKYSTGNIKLKGRKEINNNIASWDKAIPIPEYVSEFRRIIKSKGNVFIFTSYNLFGDWHKELDPVFDICNFMVWHKTNPTPRIYKNSFLNSCEMIICAWDRGHTWNFSTQDKMHNFIESKICMKPERLDHPTQKPLTIIKQIIEIATNPRGSILDCFAGVGTTGVAALLTDRKYFLVEIDKKYYQIARQRLESAKTRLDNMRLDKIKS